MSCTHQYQALRRLSIGRIAAVGLEGILSEVSSASSQKRRTSKKPKAKNIEKSCSYRPNENVPPRFKQYKIQGNASNLVQSHFGSPASKVLESGIAPLVPLGFYPACWGLNQTSPSSLGLLRSARISTAISGPPFQPTERLFLYQN